MSKKKRKADVTPISEEESRRAFIRTMEPVQDRLLGEMHRRGLTVDVIRKSADAIERILRMAPDLDVTDMTTAGFLFGLRFTVRMEQDDE